jgi:transglutaminase-like putative cysteine protease
MRFSITHVTRYAYAWPASESFMEARLTPVTCLRQRLLSRNFRSDPDCRPQAYRDYFGNAVDTFSIIRRHERLTVTCESEVETLPSNPPTGAMDVTVSEVRQLYRGQRIALYEYLVPSPGIQPSALAHRVARRLLKPEAPAGEAVERVMAWIHQRFTYRPGSTSVETTVEQFCSTGAGVCQDFANLMIAILRAGGIPARYVCGYIETENQRAAAAGAVPLVGASESHAWVEAYLPGGYWLALDPTNNCRVGERHVAVAKGRDFHDTSPTRGVFKGAGSHHLSVEVVMRRLTEA